MNHHIIDIKSKNQVIAENLDKLESGHSQHITLNKFQQQYGFVDIDLSCDDENDIFMKKEDEVLQKQQIINNNNWFDKLKSFFKLAK